MSASASGRRAANGAVMALLLIHFDNTMPNRFSPSSNFPQPSEINSPNAWAHIGCNSNDGVHNAIPTSDRSVNAENRPKTPKATCDFARKKHENDGAVKNDAKMSSEVYKRMQSMFDARKTTVNFEEAKADHMEKIEASNSRQFMLDSRKTVVDAEEIKTECNKASNSRFIEHLWKIFHI